MRRGVFNALRPFGGECNFASVEKKGALFTFGAAIATVGKSTYVTDGCVRHFCAVA